jgi:hypothetical protein
MLSNSPVFPLMYFASKRYNKSDNSRNNSSNNDNINNNTIAGGIPNLLFGLKVTANEVLELGVWYMHHDTPHI